MAEEQKPTVEEGANAIEAASDPDDLEITRLKGIIEKRRKEVRGMRHLKHAAMWALMKAREELDEYGAKTTSFTWSADLLLYRTVVFRLMSVLLEENGERVRRAMQSYNTWIVHYRKEMNEAKIDMLALMKRKNVLVSREDIDEQEDKEDAELYYWSD